MKKKDWKQGAQIGFAALCLVIGALYYAFSNPGKWDEIDFALVHAYAKKSNAIYDYNEVAAPILQSGNQIYIFPKQKKNTTSTLQLANRSQAYLKEFPREKTHDGYLTNSGLAIAIMKDEKNNCQWIVVRGTDNIKNIKKDVEYVKIKTAIEDFVAHKGFSESADEAYKWLKENEIILSKSVPIRLTGHSLGGAVAALLYKRLKKDGYTLGPCITFGQPKVTDSKGAATYANDAIIRIVNEHDPVTMIPTFSHTQMEYRHFGAAFILENKEKYRTIDQKYVSFTSSELFQLLLRDAKLFDHSMTKYLERIESMDGIQSDKHSDKIPVEKTLSLGLDFQY